MHISAQTAYFRAVGVLSWLVVQNEGYLMMRPSVLIYFENFGFYDFFVPKWHSQHRTERYKIVKNILNNFSSLCLLVNDFIFKIISRELFKRMPLVVTVPATARAFFSVLLIWYILILKKKKNDRPCFQSVTGKKQKWWQIANKNCKRGPGNWTLDLAHSERERRHCAT